MVGVVIGLEGGEGWGGEGRGRGLKLISGFNKRKAMEEDKTVHTETIFYSVFGVTNTGL